jgi:glycosyltransferase involved in cell wall biosynthesis
LHVEKTAEHSTPFVSVVVPVLNAPQLLRRCLEALLAQTYPRNRYEIIVVDNGSSDETPQVAESYPVTLLFERGAQSPYPARNRGIRQARGEIIALLDATCTPVAGWLEAGVRALQQEHADLVGGEVTFTFSPERTLGEMVDAISNANVQASIKNIQATVTGNLFFRRAVVEAIGPFPDTIRSGGDMIWTGRATRAGFRLVYSAEAQVFYPARKLKPLLKKHYRIGRGTLTVWLNAKRAPLVYPYIAIQLVRGFVPVSPVLVQRRIIERGTPDMQQRFVAIWLISWLCRVATNLGRFHTLLTWARQLSRRHAR